MVATAKDEEHLKIARDLGLKSYISVPLCSQGKTIGVLGFVTSESNRLYSEYDLNIANDLAKRASLAIDNDILY